jgi:hypothetical protein
MANACLVVGWNRAIPGREHLAMELFQSTMGYYSQLQAQGTIESFEPVIMNSHGGDMNGFILLRGDSQKLAALRVANDFVDLETQAMLCLEGVGVISGYLNEGVQQRMQTWGKHIQKYAK